MPEYDDLIGPPIGRKGLGRQFGVRQRAGKSTKVSGFPHSLAAALEHLPRSTNFDLPYLLYPFDTFRLVEV
jgi:hypothetical protein